MPPADAPQPSDADKQALIGWLTCGHPNNLDRFIAAPGRESAVFRACGYFRGPGDADEEGAWPCGESFGTSSQSSKKWKRTVQSPGSRTGSG
jgi:hypothetical protein